MKRPVVDLTESKDKSNDYDYINRGTLGSFLNGTIRLTQGNTDKFDPDKISFKEIIQNPQYCSTSHVKLDHVLVTSFVADEAWLHEMFYGVPKVILCTDDGARDKHVKIEEMFTTNGEKWTLVYPSFPTFPAYGVMHCKLMLLKYHHQAKGECEKKEEYLRIVISSGNLVPYDYDQVQNIVFIQDVIRDTKQPNHQFCGEFINDLSFLLRHLGINATLYGEENWAGYDLNQIRPKLVYSIPGTTTWSASQGNGLAMLKHKLEELNKGIPEARIVLEYIGSSLGAMDKPWLDEFKKVCGLVGGEDNATISRKIKRTKLINASSDKDNNSEQVLKVIFPTMDYAKHSIVGPSGFGTLFCRSNQWKKLSYPKNLFHQAESNWQSTPAIHAKILTAFDETNTIPLWCYIGSHNFTPSAWGRSIRNGANLMIANYEVGVILKVQTDNENFLPNGKFPFPYKRPVRPFTGTDIPWMQDLYFDNEGGGNE